MTPGANRHKKRKIAKTLNLLASEYPDAHCTLDAETSWQLLVATILSAQSTDFRVNQVTPHLFLRFPTVHSMAGADLQVVEELIRSIGVYRIKAKNIISCATTIVERYGGDVPASLDELVKLPGVGRKTANVVLGNVFGIPAITVDTHVFRVTHRLGWIDAKNAEAVEHQLNEILPRSDWTKISHRLIFHGRRICIARQPKCNECVLFHECPKIGVGKII